LLGFIRVCKGLSGKKQKNSLRLKEHQGMVRVHLPINYSAVTRWVRTNTRKSAKKFPGFYLLRKYLFRKILKEYKS
jgi:hypothetical protein